MTINISPTLMMWLPIIGVFCLFTLISLFKYKDMSSGGGDAGMIGGMMCIFMPIALTILFAIPYGAAILMGMIFR